MSPITSTLANGSAYGYRRLAAAGAAPSFESIATFTPNNTTNTYTFSSIPGTYKNLQLRMNTTGSLQNQIILQANGVSGTSYAYHFIDGRSSSTSAGSGTGTSNIQIYGASYGTVATHPTVSIVDIIDYASGSKNKTFRTLSAANGNTTNIISGIQLGSGLFMSTSAITSLTVTYMSNNITSGSIALYGVK
jgi:hypothetical protein